MDFITQNLLGAVAAQASLTSRLGRKAALPGLIGGALPDFDFLLHSFADPALPFEWHRHFTHAFIMIPSIGALAAVPCFAFPAFRRAPGLTVAAATIGAATHGVLDNLTSYGTHLWWPFYDGRTAWDVLSIIDPVVTVTLLLGFLGTLLWARHRPARTAFVIFLAYIAYGFVQHGRAAAVQRDLAEARGDEVTHSRVMPTIGNSILFRSVYRTADGAMQADAIRVGVFRRPVVREGDRAPVVERMDLPPIADPSRLDDVFTRFAAFADGYVARANASTGRWIIGDMRYSADPAAFDPIWGIEIAAGDLVSIRWTDDIRPTSVRLDHIIAELFGPDVRYAPAR